MLLEERRNRESFKDSKPRPTIAPKEMAPNTLAPCQDLAACSSGDYSETPSTSHELADSNTRDGFLQELFLEELKPDATKVIWHGRLHNGTTAS
jgi:hypothetical protein